MSVIHFDNIVHTVVIGVTPTGRVYIWTIRFSKVARLRSSPVSARS